MQGGPCPAPHSREPPPRGGGGCRPRAHRRRPSPGCWQQRPASVAPISCQRGHLVPWNHFPWLHGLPYSGPALSLKQRGPLQPRRPAEGPAETALTGMRTEALTVACGLGLCSQTPFRQGGSPALLPPRQSSHVVVVQKALITGSPDLDLQWERHRERSMSLFFTFLFKVLPFKTETESKVQV